MGRFGTFQAPARKVVPGSLQRAVLKHFRRQPAKSSQEASRRSFWSMSGAGPQSDTRRHPENRFEAFQAPARKLIAGGLQRIVLKYFRRQPAKWSQEASRGSFWKISGASPPSGPRRPPEDRFRIFQAPARQIVPGSLQRVVLKHFRRQPAKWPQEASRGWF